MGKIIQQNIYDNDIFFEKYEALRETKDNFNILLEQPAMKRLLPDLKNKSVLEVCEPLPDDKALKTRPGLKKEFIKPTFLIVMAEK